jgi:hypothetical protein
MQTAKDCRRQQRKEKRVPRRNTNQLIISEEWRKNVASGHAETHRLVATSINNADGEGMLKAIESRRRQKKGAHTGYAFPKKIFERNLRIQKAVHPFKTPENGLFCSRGVPPMT